MATPLKPLPAVVVRWRRRAHWLRGFDAVAAWLVVWAGLMAVGHQADGAAVGVLAAVLVALAAAVPAVRRRWRPVTGVTALVMSWRFRPGERAWRVTPDGGDPVLVTGCRGWRVVLVSAARDPIEGVALRRTHALLVRADGS